jgi:hypothetical protein
MSCAIKDDALLGRRRRPFQAAWSANNTRQLIKQRGTTRSHGPSSCGVPPAPAQAVAAIHYDHCADNVCTLGAVDRLFASVLHADSGDQGGRSETDMHRPANLLVCVVGSCFMEKITALRRISKRGRSDSSAAPASDSPPLSTLRQSQPEESLSVVAYNLWAPCACPDLFVHRRGACVQIAKNR